jgi:hypothetical protein
MAKADAIEIKLLSEIDRKLKLVIVNQNKLLDELEGNLPIIPALEKAVKQAKKMSKQIDEKVPDNP